MSNEKTKPVETVRVGSVKIAVWKNQGDDGPYYTPDAPEFSYVKDGKWHSSKRPSGQRDLINLAKAALLADTAIGKLRYEDRKAAGQPTDPSAEASAEVVEEAA